MLENGIYTILQAESILSNWQTHYSITCSPSPSVLYSQWREEFTERDWKQVALKHIFLFSQLMVQQVRHNRGNATSQMQQSCILFTKSPKRWTAMQKSCDNRQIKDWMPPYRVFVFASLASANCHTLWLSFWIIRQRQSSNRNKQHSRTRRLAYLCHWGVTLDTANSKSMKNLLHGRMGQDYVHKPWLH